MSVKDDLSRLSERYGVKLAEQLSDLETKLTDELEEDIKNACAEKYGTGKYSESAVRGAAEMFVNNNIIEQSIYNDPSGDWEGVSRCEDIGEYLDDSYDPDDDEDDEDDDWSDEDDEDEEDS